MRERKGRERKVRNPIGGVVNRRWRLFIFLHAENPLHLLLLLLLLMEQSTRSANFQIKLKRRLFFPLNSKAGERKCETLSLRFDEEIVFEFFFLFLCLFLFLSFSHRGKRSFEEVWGIRFWFFFFLVFFGWGMVVRIVWISV